MPSCSIPLTGAVKAPVCSRVAEHSKKAASLHVSELCDLAILTKREAASLLRVTTRYLERAIASGRLRACKPTGKMLRIYRRDLDKFLEAGASINE